MSTSSQTKLRAETLIENGGFIRLTVDREEYLKLRVRTRMPVIPQKREEEFEPE
jgi:hypothetical protein